MTTIFVALDGLVDDERRTLDIAETLSGGEIGFKLNLDYVLIRGLKSAVSVVKSLGKPIFVDLKMWNGSRTMARIVEELVGLDVDYLNIHAFASESLSAVFKELHGARTRFLGVTILTHLGDSYCHRYFHRSLMQMVRYLAVAAINAGCQGIVLPGTALDGVRDIDTIKVVPGIRPYWYRDARHSEEIEPRMAVERGADILVCGSPIMRSANPSDALRRILEEMKA